MRDGRRIREGGEMRIREGGAKGEQGEGGAKGEQGEGG